MATWSFNAREALVFKYRNLENPVRPPVELREDYASALAIATSIPPFYSDRFMVGKVSTWLSTAVASMSHSFAHKDAIARQSRAKEGKLHFGDAFTSSTYHLWGLKWTMLTEKAKAVRQGDAPYAILFSAEDDESHQISSYSYDKVHSGIIVDDIDITNRDDLILYGVNNDNIDHKFEKNYLEYTDGKFNTTEENLTGKGTWFTKIAAGKPRLDIPTMPDYENGSGLLYLVTVKGYYHSSGKPKIYIMATWNKDKRTELIEKYNSRKYNHGPSVHDLDKLGLDRAAAAPLSLSVSATDDRDMGGGRYKSKKSNKRKKSKKNKKYRTRTRKNRGFKKNKKTKNKNIKKTRR